jgi:hypothetical protein
MTLRQAPEPVAGRGRGVRRRHVHGHMDKNVA